MDFEFRVTCNVSYQSGKFASRDDVASEIISSIEQGDPGQITANEGEYEVGDFTVEEISSPTRRQAKHAARVESAKREIDNALTKAVAANVALPADLLKAFARLSRLRGEKPSAT